MHISININAPNETVSQDLISVHTSPGITVKDLKVLVEADTGFPAAAQQFYLNGRALSNEVQTLDDAGIKDGEMLMLLVRRRGNPPQGTAPQTTARGNPDPEDVRQQLLNNPAARANLSQNAPDLFATLNDPGRWREEYNNMVRRQQDAERERQEQIEVLNNDPFNVDAQRKIEDIIRQDRVIENLQHAYEHNPEVFARVHMLYINAEVNGHPVKAFVDSGAQATIMSPSCAEACGIMRLLDTRYSGIAKGVGTAKILGRVHHAEIKIGGAVMPCAFTVMEGKDVDLLFGLDMLKRYKAKIDLEKNALCFEGIEVPFLPEHEIPRQFQDAEVNEPTVPGPNGTEIGGHSGAVRPAGGKAPVMDSSEPGPSTQASSSAAPPVPAPRPPPADQDIEQLTNLGFARHAAVQALNAAGGDVNLAAQLLLENS